MGITARAMGCPVAAMNIAPTVTRGWALMKAQYWESVDLSPVVTVAVPSSVVSCDDAMLAAFFAAVFWVEGVPSK